MSVDVRPSVVIARGRADVAAVMFDPSHDLAWTGGITASHPAQDGPLVEGATVERTARFLGRTFTYRYVVTASEPQRVVELRVERPFPMTVRYQLEDVGVATLGAIHAAGSPGRILGWATPLMAGQVRRSISADLDRLSACLEV